jgi:hypothetical protein
VKFGRTFGLPLLGKELVEQAARKRTYITRAIYATLLFAGFGLCYATTKISYFGPGSWVAMLGRGRMMFEYLMILQFLGIYLFLPAMMAGVITTEKERESLALLFLTDMGPWAILLQKYLGRLVPMFTFLLLSLPLMGVTYALGGVSIAYLLSGVYLLFLTCLQVGAFALMWSAFCRTTVGAVLTTYICGVAIYLFQPIGWLFVRIVTPRFGYYGYRSAMPDGLTFSFFPPWIFFDGRNSSLAFPIWLSVILFLMMARVFLTRRAFIPPRNMLLEWFKGLDRFMTGLNKYFGNIVLIKDKAALPDMEPVAWRETTKKSLGKARYLFRVFVIVLVPTTFVGFLVISDTSRGGGSEGVTLLVFGLWTLAILVLSIQGANAISSERGSQTLDVLLTTPMTGRDIIRQKTQALQRLTQALAVVFLTIFAMEVWWRFDTAHDRWVFAVSSVLSLLVYLPMIIWISLWIGLRTRTRFRAIMTAVAVFVGWCALPLIMLITLTTGAVFNIGDMARSFLACLLSPAGFIIILTDWNEWSSFGEIDRWVLVLVNFCFYGSILYYARWLCLTRADRYLRGE